jgi:hypothetical protein
MTDQLLRDTFVAHEHLAPDADLTLAAINDQLRTRRRRAVTATLSTTGAAAAVAAVAVGVTFVGATHRGQHPTTAPPATRPTTATHQPHRAAPPPVTVQLGIAAGWLPPGKVTRGFVSDAFGSDTVIYTVTPRSGPAVDITLQTSADATLSDDAKRGPGSDLQLNGRPAREYNDISNTNSYYIEFLTAHGSANVAVGATDPDKVVPAATRQQIGRHVASGMIFDRHVKVATPIALGYVPAGLAAKRIDTQDADTIITLAPTAARADVDTYTTLDLQSVAYNGRPSFTPGTEADITTSRGRPVKGHTTWVERWGPASTDPDTGITLTVLDAAPGRTLVITGGRTVTSLAELYKIADSITIT